MANDSTLLEKRMPMQYIHGVPFPCGLHFLKENILSAIEYQPRDDEIILVSYPKTGSTWMQYIVLQVTKGPECFPQMNDLNTVAPFVEHVGASRIENMESPRVWKTHFPYDLVPKNDNAKYIYTFRDPRDVFVSFYHFLSSMRFNELSFNELFECFMSGCIPFGDYFDHLQSWLAHKNNPHVLLVSYENLKANPRQYVFKIAEFLGEQYSNRLKTEEGLVDQILSNTSFDHMKEKLRFDFQGDDSNKADTSEKTPSTQEEGPGFFRKGTVGDWKNHLSKEQARRLEEKCRAKLVDEELLLKLWNI